MFYIVLNSCIDGCLTTMREPQELYRMGLRIDRIIMEYVDKYKYGTRSEVVRNMLHEYLSDRDPIVLIDNLVKQFQDGDITAEVFTNRITIMKENIENKLVLYREARNLMNHKEMQALIERTERMAKLRNLDAF